MQAERWMLVLSHSSLQTQSHWMAAAGATCLPLAWAAANAGSNPIQGTAVA